MLIMNGEINVDLTSCNSVNFSWWNMDPGLGMCNVDGTFHNVL